jgi:gamma-glutamyltranspeptidase
VHGPSPENGTTQVTVVDGEGNVVSMTTTVESGFGVVPHDTRAASC